MHSYPNDKGYCTNFCQLKRNCLFLPVFLMTLDFTVKEQSASSKALAGSVASAEVPLIPNVVTERLPGPDGKAARE